MPVDKFVDNDWNVEFRASDYDIIIYVSGKRYIKAHCSLDELKEFLLSDWPGKITVRDNSCGKITEYE